MGEFFVNMATGTTDVGQSGLFQNTEKSFGPRAGQLQHSIYVNCECFINLKKCNTLKYTTSCRGINGNCASETEKNH